jgi:mannose-6-phosphate isomerase-like protein (cupin superfamily)
VHAFTVDELDERRLAKSEPWLEFERSTSLSAGLYVLQTGEADLQTPHNEDEIYVVVSGTARFVASGEPVEVGPGTVLFVAAHEPHRFEEVNGPLRLVVVFAPPESS